jgi:bifunctional non-homologous end joining protein LigD
MGLTRYRQKRDFSKSPEPRGGRSGSDRLVFVVQKHDASHLHYDFRLEMEGVLKSWAVPKGPSTDPSVKRLAMMVEDHPFDYRNFEGIIPSGYGAGTVMVWDEGTYAPAGENNRSKKDMDRELRRQLHAGKLKFRLNGKKLKGEFALVKAPARGENAWLLMKVKDENASEKDILSKDRSVISRRTLAEIEEAPAATWQSHRPDDRTAVPRKTKRLKHEQRSPAALKPGEGKKAPFPRKLVPMLATLAGAPKDEPGWIYEVKWDGYRALGFSNKGKIELRSRNDKSFNEKFYPVYSALREWGINAVVDGEIVAVNDRGISDFSALQNWRSEADGDLLYYVFDVLWLEGRDLTALSLTRRREILRAIVPSDGIIRMSENFGESATQFFEVARKMGLEGIIAKKSDSSYHPGVRTKEWLKIKAGRRQEVVIGGYTRNEDSAKLFSSLLVGVYDGKELVYTGKVGTGFDTKTQQEMMKLFRPLTRKGSPFSHVPDINKPSRFRPDPPRAVATWLKPQLVCEVNYAELTGDGVMRHPSFIGMRTDKEAKDVRLEAASHMLPLADESKSGAGSVGKALAAGAGRKERKTLLNPRDETQVRKVNGHELKFTNLSKVFWPKEKFTKRDLINYYYQVAPYILPYLKDRPQSMNRHPNGINGESFYQKDVTGKAPGWIKTFLYHSSFDQRDKHFLVCTNEASLLYMASLGCIELNPWSSTIHTPDKPDWCVIDLDPGKMPFSRVIEVARVTRQVLDALGVNCYPKTSGSKGIHIYIPLGAKYDYEQSKEFARVIATMVHHEMPKYTSIERVVKNRGGKMYIDFLQNRPQATLAAPYAVRPKPGATVSMPLHWDEVKPGLKMTDFNIRNAVERVRSEGDIFKPVLGKGISLSKVIKKLENVKAA